MHWYEVMDKWIKAAPQGCERCVWASYYVDRIDYCLRQKSGKQVYAMHSSIDKRDLELRRLDLIELRLRDCIAKMEAQLPNNEASPLSPKAST